MGKLREEEGDMWVCLCVCNVCVLKGRPSRGQKIQEEWAIEGSRGGNRLQEVPESGGGGTGPTWQTDRGS